MLIKSRLLHAAAIGAVLAATGSMAMAAPVASGKPGETVTTGQPSRYGGPSQFRPTFSVPSLKTSFAVGGYVRLDAFYDMDYDQGPTPNPFTLWSKPETDGTFDMQSNEARINFRSSTETDIGQIDTVFEWDFFASGGTSEELNLRHAFAEVDNFLFGRTWTNAWMTIGSVRTVKYGGMAGASWASRQSQLRYTMPMGKSLFAVSIEDPDGLGIATVGGTVTPENKLPDVTARYELGRMLGVSGVVRPFSTATAGDATGWGVNLQGSYNVLPSTALKLSAWMGEGIASYVPGGSTAGGPNAAFRDGYIAANGELELVELTGIQVGIHQKWSKTLSSDIGYTVVEQDDIPVAGLAPGSRVAAQTQYAQASLWWEPVPRFALAAEYTWVENERQVDGQSRDASRIQTSAIVQF